MEKKPITTQVHRRGVLWDWREILLPMWRVFLMRIASTCGRQPSFKDNTNKKINHRHIKRKKNRTEKAYTESPVLKSS